MLFSRFSMIYHSKSHLIPLVQALLRAGAGACAPLRDCVLPCAGARASQVYSSECRIGGMLGLLSLKEQTSG